MTLNDLFPDATRMSEVFSHAAAPAFFLGACVGLGSLLMARLNDVMGRLRQTERTERQAGFLRRRAILLHSALRFALAGGLATTLLLAVAFASAFLQLRHVYGAAILFLLATCLIGFSLLRFVQEVKVGLEELEMLTGDDAQSAPGKVST
jgi:hypothetical protein